MQLAAPDCSSCAGTVMSHRVPASQQQQNDKQHDVYS